MNKYILITIILIISTTIVQANTIDRSIANIQNCYNLTIKIEPKNQTGNIDFPNCKNTGGLTWTCECREEDNSYNLIMRSNDQILRNSNDYKITLNGYLYNLYKDSLTFELYDYGDYIETDEDNNELGKYGEYDECKGKREIEYINKTIYIPKIEIKEVIIEKNNTIYTENTTKIEELNKENNELKEKINNQTKQIETLKEENKGYKKSIWGVFIGFIGIIILICIVIYRIRKNEEERV